MSNERVTASVKRDHIHLMNRLFKWDETTQKWVAQPEVFFSTPNIAVDMGNFVGALNWYEHEQYPDAPIPDPIPTDPAQSIRARATTFGKWAAWKLASSAELDAMKAEFGVTPVAQLVNFYGESGGGGISVQGGMDADGIPFFWALVNGVETRTKDINGAADAYVLKMAEQQGRTVPTSPI